MSWGKLKNAELWRSRGKSPNHLVRDLLHLLRGKVYENESILQNSRCVAEPLNHSWFSLALPWTPKVRQKDVDQFLDTTRMKFVGFMLPNDRVSLAGLPQPIHEGVRVLKQVKYKWTCFRLLLLFLNYETAQHMYLSLTEIQIQREEDINKNPVSKGQEEISLTPAEILYQV